MKKHISTSQYLDIAHHYATIMSGCTKVKVGSVIVSNDGHILSFGANRAVPDLCNTRGCLRIEKYGENSKLHRNPEDCRAIHSEIDAIANSREPLTDATIYVTRYPCEACARAIVSSGISKVVYGRDQDISEETFRIFEHEHIEVTKGSFWTEEDVTY